MATVAISNKPTMGSATAQAAHCAGEQDKFTAAIEKALGGVDKARPATAGKKAPDAG